MFVTRNGRPLCRTDVYRAWKGALAKVGIEGAHIHSLRHSFVSRHAERNTPVALTAVLVGHSRPTKTQAVYTRLRGAEAAQIEAMRAALA